MMDSNRASTPSLFPIVQSDKSFLEIFQVREAFGPKECFGSLELMFEGALQ
jgi:hypothetical protein